MSRFVTNLWFEKDADKAAAFYVSLFDNAKVTRTLHFTKSGAEIGGMKEGDVMTVDFSLDDQEFTLINGGPAFKQSEAASILVKCKDQAEMDRLWEALTEGGEESYCGWLKDRWGLSWQIIPEFMDAVTPEEDPEKYEHMMQVVLATKGKLNLDDIKKAYNG